MQKIERKITHKALEHYRHLHQHPELSFQEISTSAYIRKVLAEEQIAYETVAGTGTIAILPGQDTSRTLALRADIDALPIQENTGHTIYSQNPGIMHACGHDLHTACLLGAAHYLNALPVLPTNVLLIFQHAEEVLPGGAQDILCSKTFIRYKPEKIFALHAEPELKIGQVGLHSGQYMASGDEIYITVKGPGGHAALPNQTVDLVVVASEIVLALQTVSSRYAPPFIPTVLTFGNIRCNSVMNIIPKEIRLEGTFRTFDETWRQKAKEHITEISRSIASGAGAQCEIEIKEGYPCLYNDPLLTVQVTRILEKELGKSQVYALPQRMTTEDFARYSQQIPAVFMRLGITGEKAEGKLHTPDFQASPEAIEYGIRIFCLLATQA